MRIRNNKVNVFLSDDEKFILKRDSSKLNLSQSEYIRNLIIGYEIKIPEVKEEQKPKKDEYIIENQDEKNNILNIKKKNSSDIGMVSIGFLLNGCVLALTHTDEWMVSLMQLVKFITDKKESEGSYSYWQEQNKIREQAQLERKEKEEKKEEMIKKVEELTDCERFQNFKTKGEMLLFWENNIPDLYQTLSRTFMEKMARKYISIVRST